MIKNKSSCPFCDFDLQMMNRGKGIYFKCPNCHAVVYNFSMLKREGFKKELFSRFLLNAKQNKTNFQGNCGNCGHPFREAKYDLNDYQSKIYVCPTCLNFVISAIELPIFRNTDKPTEKSISPNAQVIIDQLDDRLDTEKKKWKKFDQSIKISKTRSISFFIFLFGLFYFYSKMITNDNFPSIVSPFIAVISLIICILAGLFILFGWKNIVNITKKYFDKW